MGEGTAAAADCANAKLDQSRYWIWLKLFLLISIPTNIDAVTSIP